MICCYYLFVSCPDVPVSASAGPSAARISAVAAESGSVASQKAASDRAQADTPLSTAVGMYYERMPSSAKRRHLMLARDGIQKGIESTDDHNFIGVASACSGTDIGVICLEVVLAMICGLVGISARVAHVFACEKNPLKRAFLQSQFSPTNMFADAAQLGQRMAWCLQMGKSVIVPWCFVFMAGFSCKKQEPSELDGFDQRQLHSAARHINRDECHLGGDPCIYTQGITDHRNSGERQRPSLED